MYDPGVCVCVWTANIKENASMKYLQPIYCLSSSFQLLGTYGDHSNFINEHKFFIIFLF